MKKLNNNPIEILQLQRDKLKKKGYSTEQIMPITKAMVILSTHIEDLK